MASFDGMGTVGVVTTTAVAEAVYSLSFVYVCLGFVWLVSPQWFRHYVFILRRGIPWLNPKTLSVLGFLAFLPVRMAWIFLVLFDSDIQAQFVLLQVSFLLLLTHLTLFVCYWGETIVYFARKQYGERRSESAFFHYKVTRWVCAAALVFMYGLKGVLIALYLFIHNLTTLEDDSAIADKINLIANSILLLAIVLFFFLHAAVVSWFIIRNSAERREVWVRLVKVLGILLLFSAVELIKISVFVYKLTLPGYQTGGLPVEAYLILAFFMPDLVPSMVLVTLELISRRADIKDKLMAMEMFQSEQASKRSRAAQNSKKSFSIEESKDLETPLMNSQQEDEIPLSVLLQAKPAEQHNES